MVVDSSASVYRMETPLSSPRMSAKASCDLYNCPEVLWRKNKGEGGGRNRSCKLNTEKDGGATCLSVSISTRSSTLASLNFPESFALIRLNASLQRPHGSPSLLLERQKHEDEDVKSELVS